MTTFAWALSALIGPGTANAPTAAQRASQAASDDAAVERVRSRLLKLIAADSLANRPLPPRPKADQLP